MAYGLQVWDGNLTVDTSLQTGRLIARGTVTTTNASKDVSIPGMLNNPSWHVILIRLSSAGNWSDYVKGINKFTILSPGSFNHAYYVFRSRQ